MPVRLAPVFHGSGPAGPQTTSRSLEIPTPSAKTKTPLLRHPLGLDSAEPNPAHLARPHCPKATRPGTKAAKESRHRHAQLGTQGGLDPGNNRIPTQQHSPRPLPMSLTRWTTRQRTRPRVSLTAPAPIGAELHLPKGHALTSGYSEPCFRTVRICRSAAARIGQPTCWVSPPCSHSPLGGRTTSAATLNLGMPKYNSEKAARAFSRFGACPVSARCRGCWIRIRARPRRPLPGIALPPKASNTAVLGTSG